MQVTFTVSQMLVRITGVLLLILGLLIWAENANGLIGIHMLLGLIFVLALLVFAFAARQAGASLGMAIGLAVLGVLVLWLGVSQQGLLNGPADPHWIVRVVHLLIGVAAVGMAEAVGGGLRRAQLARA